MSDVTGPEATDDSGQATGSAPRVVRVVGGEPSSEELAAVVAVLTAAGGTDPSPNPPPRHTGWADPARRLRAPLRPGPTAWRTSTRH